MSQQFRTQRIGFLLLPLLWIAVIVYNQFTFYPFTQEVRLHSYEFELLYILFAPFVFSLPKHPHAAMNVTKRLYIWGFTLAVLFYVIGTLLSLYGMSTRG